MKLRRKPSYPSESGFWFAFIPQIIKIDVEEDLMVKIKYRKG